MKVGFSQQRGVLSGGADLLASHPLVTRSFCSDLRQLHSSPHPPYPPHPLLSSPTQPHPTLSPAPSPLPPPALLGGRPGPAAGDSHLQPRAGAGVRHEPVQAAAGDRSQQRARGLCAALRRAKPCMEAGHAGWARVEGASSVARQELSAHVGPCEDVDTKHVALKGESQRFLAARMRRQSAWCFLAAPSGRHGTEPAHVVMWARCHRAELHACPPPPPSAPQSGGYPVRMLNTQYRMHPAISTFPSRQFYGGGLLDGEVRACLCVCVWCARLCVVCVCVWVCVLRVITPGAPSCRSRAHPCTSRSWRGVLLNTQQQCVAQFPFPCKPT